MRRRHTDFVSIVRRSFFIALFAAPAFVTGCSRSTEPLRGPHLEALTSMSLTAMVGTEVAPAPAVQVTDGDGAPLPGIVVEFLKTGTATIGNASARTDAQGIATSGGWTLGAVAGTQMLTAHSAGLRDVAFTAVATAGPATGMASAGGNRQTATAGSTLTQPLRVRLVDSFGNPVPDAAVTFTILSGDGVIGGVPAITDSAGVAVSGKWTLGPLPGAQQVLARSGSVELVLSANACEGDRCGQLLFERNGQIHWIDLSTGQDLPLTAGGGYHAAWSPDGQRIAFARRTGIVAGDIYLMDADGSNVIRRTVGMGFDTPSWSPDGRTLAVSNGGGYWGDVFLISAEDDGKAPVRVATNAVMPAWSPDGRKIAFVSLSGDDGYHALWVANADGSGVMALTLRDEGSISHPTWSPDGRRIAYSKCLDGCDVYVVQVDDPSVTQLTFVRHAGSPAWSPDGTRIAFNLWVEPDDDLVEPLVVVAYVAADGDGDPIPIITEALNPAWRP